LAATRFPVTVRSGPRRLRSRARRRISDRSRTDLSMEKRGRVVAHDLGGAGEKWHGTVGPAQRSRWRAMRLPSAS
jgi:hypothetical protein